MHSAIGFPPQDRRDARAAFLPLASTTALGVRSGPKPSSPPKVGVQGILITAPGSTPITGWWRLRPSLCFTMGISSKPSPSGGAPG